MLGVFRSFFAWRSVWDSGVWLYQENHITKKRRVLKISPCHQPLDMAWLGDGEVYK